MSLIDSDQALPTDVIIAPAPRPPDTLFLHLNARRVFDVPSPATSLSDVPGDKICCVHEANDAEAVREPERRGGSPADLVTEVTGVIDPSTADVPGRCRDERP